MKTKELIKRARKIAKKSRVAKGDKFCLTDRAPEQATGTGDDRCRTHRRYRERTLPICHVRFS